jgi:hypothetical protein
MYQGSRCSGRFFGRRVNCEQVPLLPAGAIARVLDDWRKIPYLLVWKSRFDGTVQEAVRITSHNEIERLRGLDWAGAVEIKRPNGTSNFIRTLFRPLPRNGGRVRLLICPHCPRAVWVGARRTVHYQRRAINVGVLEMQWAALCVRRWGARTSRTRCNLSDAWGRLWPVPLRAPRAVVSLRFHLTPRGSGSGCCVANEIHC